MKPGHRLPTSERGLYCVLRITSIIPAPCCIAIEGGNYTVVVLAVKIFAACFGYGGSNKGVGEEGRAENIVRF